MPDSHCDTIMAAPTQHEFDEIGKCGCKIGFLHGYTTWKIKSYDKDYLLKTINGLKRDVKFKESVIQDMTNQSVVLKAEKLRLLEELKNIQQYDVPQPMILKHSENNLIPVNLSDNTPANDIYDAWDDLSGQLRSFPPPSLSLDLMPLSIFDWRAKLKELYLTHANIATAHLSARKDAIQTHLTAILQWAQIAMIHLLRNNNPDELRENKVDIIRTSKSMNGSLSLSPEVQFKDLEDVLRRANTLRLRDSDINIHYRGGSTVPFAKDLWNREDDVQGQNPLYTTSEEEIFRLRKELEEAVTEKESLREEKETSDQKLMQLERTLASLLGTDNSYVSLQANMTKLEDALRIAEESNLSLSAERDTLLRRVSNQENDLNLQLIDQLRKDLSSTKADRELIAKRLSVQSQLEEEIIQLKDDRRRLIESMEVLKGETDTARSDNESLQNRLKKGEVQLEESYHSLISLQNETVTLKAELELLKEARNKVEELEVCLGQLTSRESELKKALEVEQQQSSLSINKLHSECHELQVHVTDLESQLGQSEQESHTLEKHLTDKEGLLNDAKNEIMILTTQTNTFQNEKIQLQNTLQSLTNELAEIHQHSTVLLEEKMEEVSQAQLKKEADQKHISQLTTEKNDLKALMSEQQGLLLEVATERENLLQRVSNLDNENTHLREENTHLREEKQQYEASLISTNECLEKVCRERDIINEEKDILNGTLSRLENEYQRKINVLSVEREEQQNIQMELENNLRNVHSQITTLYMERDELRSQVLSRDRDMSDLKLKYKDELIALDQLKVKNSELEEKLSIKDQERTNVVRELTVLSGENSQLKAKEKELITKLEKYKTALKDLREMPQLRSDNIALKNALAASEDQLSRKTVRLKALLTEIDTLRKEKQSYQQQQQQSESIRYTTTKPALKPQHSGRKKRMMYTSADEELSLDMNDLPMNISDQSETNIDQVDHLIISELNELKVELTNKELQLSEMRKQYEDIRSCVTDNESELQYNKQLLIDLRNLQDIVADKEMKLSWFQANFSIVQQEMSQLKETLSKTQSELLLLTNNSAATSLQKSLEWMAKQEDLQNLLTIQKQEIDHISIVKSQQEQEIKNLKDILNQRNNEVEKMNDQLQIALSDKAIIYTDMNEKIDELYESMNNEILTLQNHLNDISEERGKMALHIENLEQEIEHYSQCDERFRSVLETAIQTSGPPPPLREDHMKLQQLGLEDLTPQYESIFLDTEKLENVIVNISEYITNVHNWMLGALNIVADQSQEEREIDVLNTERNNLFIQIQELQHQLDSQRKNLEEYSQEKGLLVNQNQSLQSHVEDLHNKNTQLLVYVQNLENQLHDPPISCISEQDIHDLNITVDLSDTCVTHYQCQNPKCNRMHKNVTTSTRVIHKVSKDHWVNPGIAQVTPAGNLKSSPKLEVIKQRRGSISTNPLTTSPSSTP